MQLRIKHPNHWAQFTNAMIGVFAVVASCWAAGEPANKYTEWTSEREIFVPMRDGVHLSTDIWQPNAATGKFPTILVRTPYGKDLEMMATAQWRELWLKQGYAVVVQNERGRYFSEGEFKNYLQGASTDGFDTIQWIAQQSWSNGKVGMLGCSSSAETQWPTAASEPPALAAMIPAASGPAVGEIPGNQTRGAFYHGGVPAQFGTWAGWYVENPTERLLLPPQTSREQRIRLSAAYSLDTKALFGWTDVQTLMHLPSKDILRSVDAPLSPWDNYITWTPGDPRWNQVEQIGAGAKPRAPALHLNTWHDVAIGETTRLFKYLQDLGTPNQYLIVGAGPHCSMMLDEMMSDLSMADVKALTAKVDPARLPDFDMSNFKFGDLDVGDARYQGIDNGYTKLFRDWFNYWLNSEQNHVLDMPKVQLYVMGQGWISGDRWPLNQTRFTNYYLGSGPIQDALPRGGELAVHVPTHHGEDQYTYDPSNPAPSLGGACCDYPAARDQRPVELRQDVLTYSTPLLEKAITIAGPIDVVLYVSSSAKDTDFIVKLIDVYPDGKAINLGDDAFRVRYREGFDKKVLMQSGKIYRIDLHNMVTAIRFPQGHRIRLEISSSDFPLYERNLNTGGNNYDETRWVVANNSVHYGRQYPSHVVLPVIPDESSGRESGR